jgi:hypothetical protein
MHSEQLLRPKEVAQRLRVSERHLARWRIEGGGPVWGAFYWPLRGHAGLARTGDRPWVSEVGARTRLDQPDTNMARTAASNSHHERRS